MGAERAAPSDGPGALRFRHLDLITASFVATLLISNIASTKIVRLGPLEFDGGTLLFPLSYIFGDILTEVYGFRRSRRVIWIGFAWIALAAAFLWLVDRLPPAPGYELAEAFAAVLGQSPRIVAGSLLAFWAGAFTNAALLAALKLRTAGRHLWLRTVSSTVAGQAVDTAIFLGVAFVGVLPTDLLRSVFASNYVFKVGIEVLCTPLTYLVVAALKRAELSDPVDAPRDLNPFGRAPRASTIAARVPDGT